MDHDVDDDTLRNLEAGLYPRRHHTRDASHPDSWLTNMKNSFTRPALGIFQNQISSHQHGVPGYSENDHAIMRANDEDLTGMKIMFQMDYFPTNFVTKDCSKQTGVSCVSPRNTTPPTHSCSEPSIVSLPSAASSNTPPLTPDCYIGILHSTSLEIANTQSGLSLPLHISRRSPTPPLAIEHRCSINEGKMPERPQCFDGLIADITFDSLQDAQPPWLDEEFEEWYWLDYALKLSRDGRCSSESEHRAAGESCKNHKSSMTLYTCEVFPPFHTQEDEERYRWKRKHRSRDRNEARQRR
ncbi:hypothetical protein F4604DRAFT_1929157 [Suillus subluteus]|nr:hypothetical protein F4604DRAFT_1929157 [Suillus subluteus]